MTRDRARKTREIDNKEIEKRKRESESGTEGRNSRDK